MLQIRFRDSVLFELDLVSGLGKNPDLGSVSVKIHIFFVADPDPGSGAFLTQEGSYSTW